MNSKHVRGERERERKERQQTKNLKFISENRKCSQRLQISEKTSRDHFDSWLQENQESELLQKI